ncbi:MAG TPA: LysE family translocator [Luteimonas sp.]|nr:LysE family translocator [Luteimonas sp.]
MDALMIGAAGLIAVAAITPGPNNLIVMRAAAHSGFMGALPAIAGIVAGGLAMLLLVMAGADVVFAAEPRLHRVITVGGGVYLCWLGVSLVMGGFAKPGAHGVTPARTLPAGAAALFGFQFLNPKSWVMVLTVTAGVRGGAEASQVFLPLAALFTVIPALCLALWCSLGVLMTTRPRVRSWLDRVMGVLLVVSALLLVLAPADAPLS